MAATEQEAIEKFTQYNNPAAIAAYLAEHLPGITPTPHELFKGILYAHRIAVIRIDEERKEKARKERLRIATEPMTFDNMKKRAIEIGKIIGIAEDFEFELDEHNERVLDLLCLYFTNDKRFEENGVDGYQYSLKKGIWLQSPGKGSGKTVLLRCFQGNKKSCFGYKHVDELGTIYQKGGYSALDRYIQLVEQVPSPLNFYQNNAGFMYDELFGDDKVLHMGTPLVISKYIINKLYDFSTSKNKNDKWKFHCTSNPAGPEIGKKFGDGMRSRMSEMFNLIKLEGPDRRIPKKLRQ